MSAARDGDSNANAVATRREDRPVIHITLDTGHERESPRSEVGDDVIRKLRPVILSALRGKRVAIPASIEPRSVLTGGTDDGCTIILTISAEADDCPLASIGIAPQNATEESARDVWRKLHALPMIPKRTRLNPNHVTPRPRAPWCGVRMGLRSDSLLAIGGMAWGSRAVLGMGLAR
jgi:hypothetical protein